MISTDENLSNRWDIFIHWWNFHFSWFFGWILKNKQNSKKLHVAKLSFGNMIDRILTKKHGKLTFHPWMKRFFSCKKSSSIKPLRKFYEQMYIRLKSLPMWNGNPFLLSILYEMNQQKWAVQYRFVHKRFTHYQRGEKWRLQ